MRSNDLRLYRGRGSDVLVSLLDNGGIVVNKQEECQSVSPWEQLFELSCSDVHLLSFLLEEGILRRFLKAGADPSALIVAPSGRRYEKWAATSVYLDLCFHVHSQPPLIQAPYLDILSDMLQMSADWLLNNVIDRFCTILRDKSQEELHWTVPFFAKVSNVLRLSLGARGPETKKSMQSLDQMCKQVFPFNMYRPVNVATEPRGKKRKQDSSCHRRRKHERETRMQFFLTFIVGLIFDTV